MADLFRELGPEAPTLCEGWVARDLLAHLVMRERRPDAVLGVRGGPVAGWTAKVQAGVAETPYAELVEQLRSGPPRWSPFSLPGVAGPFFGFEYFVHHEDLRRAQPEWAPRVLDPADERALWVALRPVARLAYRKSPVALVLRSGESQEIRAGRDGERAAVVAGPVQEVVLHTFGRRAAARVTVDGHAETVARLSPVASAA